MLASAENVSLQLLSVRLDFNEYYKSKDSRLVAPLTYQHRRQSDQSFLSCKWQSPPEIGTTFVNYLYKQNFLSRTREESLNFFKESLSSILSRKKLQIDDDLNSKNSQNVANEFPVFEKEFPGLLRESPVVENDISCFQISRLHFLPLSEMKVSKNLSSDCGKNETGNFSNELDLCENHFTTESPRNCRSNQKEVADSNFRAFEGRKLLSRSSLTSDISEKYLCNDTQSMINTRKERRKRRNVFCCVGWFLNLFYRNLSFDHFTSTIITVEFNSKFHKYLQFTYYIYN